MCGLGEAYYDVFATGVFPMFPSLLLVKELQYCDFEHFELLGRREFSSYLTHVLDVLECEGINIRGESVNNE